MILEQDRVKQAKENYAREREFLKLVIAKAEVYERLASNKDYQEAMNDIRDRAKAHESNANSYMRGLASPNNPFKRLRLADLIAYHETQRSVCIEIADMAQRLQQNKQDSLERLNEIDGLEKEIEQ